ncbi:type IV secretory system conjugative DNA transfer family protein [Aliikangiella sp. IMCC44359]|uniref:type IV secretory system conjugative DNA transfer family protein n=1 Tax=Aliikangiella sp. IMCC44359 TaxID=3459125 RepID=UPI00403ABA4F
MNARERIERIFKRDMELYGSAKWATQEHLNARHYGEDKALFLGYGQNEYRNKRRYQIRHSPKKHITSIAPTRGGKALSICIPVALEHQGGLVVTDVKSGEIAQITAKYRRDVLGHKVIIIDPWDEVCSSLGFEKAQLNVLDWIDTDNENYIDDAFLIADAPIADNGVKDPFWNEEARALIYGLIVYVCTTSCVLFPTQEKSKDMVQVRRLLNLPPQQFKELVEGKFEKDEDGNTHLVAPGMLQSAIEPVRAAAARILNKSSKEFSSVMSTAQSNLHFLESPAIQKALSKSTFSPADLQRGDVDIYIVMPAERNFTHNRFIRLLISIFITSVIRFDKKTKLPVYFLLEEMPVLGRMDIIEIAFSLMAGFGMTLHIICQDLTQLSGIYANTWQTFLSNSGAIQFFATFDPMTADYVSRLCGVGTVESVSETSAEMRAKLLSDPNYANSNDQAKDRPLITPDEVITMHPAVQILILSYADPVICFKTVYFLDSRYRDKNGNPIYSCHPDYADKEQPKAIDFTNPNIDIGKVIDDVLHGGG